MLIAMGSVSASTTPATATFVNLWKTGHSSSGSAPAALQSGGVFQSLSATLDSTACPATSSTEATISSEPEPPSPV